MNVIASPNAQSSLPSRVWQSIRCNNKAICITTAVVAVVGTVLALSGCASPSPATSTKIAVVATTTQVADFSRQVAGTAADVTGLVQPNQSVHAFDPSARNLLDLASADVLVTNGVALESWLNDAIQASGFKGTVIDASTGVKLIGNDPHIWTAPTNAIMMVQNIAVGLAAAKPDQAEQFQKNAATYEGQLTSLNTWITDNVAQVPLAQRLLVSNHDAFTYFYDAFDITFVGSIIPSLDDNAEPSAAELDTLIAAITSTGAGAPVTSTGVTPNRSRYSFSTRPVVSSSAAVAVVLMAPMTFTVCA